MTRRLVLIFAALALLLVAAPQASAQEAYPPRPPATGPAQLQPPAPAAPISVPVETPRAVAPTGALPRTGSDLYAAQIGAALVALGAAGVVLARRRAQTAAPAFA
jgi:LPXTG-motif cell wall-anchored protein